MVEGAGGERVSAAQVAEDLIARAYPELGGQSRRQVAELIVGLTERQPIRSSDVEAIAARMEGSRGLEPPHVRQGSDAGPGVAVREAGLRTGYGLSNREVQIARLAAQGLDNREIAARLSIGVRTVEAHLQRVYAKLGISSRAGLAKALDQRDE